MSEKTVKETAKYASFNTRMLAMIIDITIYSFTLVPLFAFIDKKLHFKKSINEIAEAKNIDVAAVIDYADIWHIFIGGLPNLTIDVAILASVTLICWVAKDATIGKAVLKMQIIDKATGNKPKLKQYIIRLIFYPVSLLLFGIGIIMINFTKDNQALHDRIAGTAVVRK